MNYQDAINQVLKHEGGFVNNPADRGGATNFGITKAVYEKFKGRTVTIAEIQKMPKTDAIVIYKANYWDKVGGDLIKSYAIAFALFDQAVNRGVSAAVKQAQRILNLNADGVVGAATIRAINSANESDFISKFLAESEAAYRKIASADPSQMVFLKGWLNRVSSLEKYVKENSTVVAAGGFGLILIGLAVFF